jgi:hypothetical protein
MTRASIHYTTAALTDFLSKTPDGLPVYDSALYEAYVDWLVAIDDEILPIDDSIANYKARAFLLQCWQFERYAAWGINATPTRAEWTLPERNMQ